MSYVKCKQTKTKVEISKEKLKWNISQNSPNVFFRINSMYLYPWVIVWREYPNSGEYSGYYTLFYPSILRMVFVKLKMDYHPDRPCERRHCNGGIVKCEQLISLLWITLLLWYTPTVVVTESRNSDRGIKKTLSDGPSKEIRSKGLRSSGR